MTEINPIVMKGFVVFFASIIGGVAGLFSYMLFKFLKNTPPECADVFEQHERSPLIFAVHAEHINNCFPESGFYSSVDGEFDPIDLLEDAGGILAERAYLEKEPKFRQVIPYVVLHMDGEILRYVRTKKGGEARLHEQHSIGIGGHIEYDDVVFMGGCSKSFNVGSTILAAEHREIVEEVGGYKAKNSRTVGLLVDHDTEVGRVHVGVVTLIELSDVWCGAEDSSISEMEFVDPSEIDRSKLEPWSAMLIDQVIPLIAV